MCPPQYILWLRLCREHRRYKGQQTICNKHLQYCSDHFMWSEGNVWAFEAAGRTLTYPSMSGVSDISLRAWVMCVSWAPATERTQDITHRTTLQPALSPSNMTISLLLSPQSLSTSFMLFWIPLCFLLCFETQQSWPGQEILHSALGGSARSSVCSWFQAHPFILARSSSRISVSLQVLDPYLLHLFILSLSLSPPQFVSLYLFLVLANKYRSACPTKSLLVMSCHKPITDYS